MRAQVLLGEGDEVFELRLERLHLDIVRVLGETQLDLRELVLRVRKVQGHEGKLQSGASSPRRQSGAGRDRRSGTEVEQVGSESATGA